MATSLSRTLFPAALVATLTVASVGLGQASKDQPDSKHGRSQQGQQAQQSGQRPQSSSQARARERTVEGKVERTREVKVRGSDAKALLAIVKTADGRRLLVDLGVKQNLKDVDVQKGEEISARGRVVRAGNVQVLLASKLWADDRTVTINRPARRSAGQQAQAAGKRAGYLLILLPREVTGTIEATEQVKLRSNAEVQNLVARVKTEKGRHLVVDLGPARNLKEFQLQKGDRITARGFDVEINGRRVLIAGRVQADGETVAIDRRGQLSRSRSSRQQQDQAAVSSRSAS